MRNFTSQVETREIADADLDTISGGLAVSGGAGLLGTTVAGGVAVDGVSELVGTVTSALPVGQVVGAAAGAAGLLGASGGAAASL